MKKIKQKYKEINLVLEKYLSIEILNIKIQIPDILVLIGYLIFMSISMSIVSTLMPSPNGIQAFVQSRLVAYIGIFTLIGAVVIKFNSWGFLLLFFLGLAVLPMLILYLKMYHEDYTTPNISDIDFIFSALSISYWVFITVLLIPISKAFNSLIYGLV